MRKLHRKALDLPFNAFVLISASAYSGKSLKDSGRISWAGDVDDAQCLRYASSDLTHASVSCSRTCRKVFEAARVMAVANAARRVSNDWP